jgi:hypothetical protein
MGEDAVELIDYFRVIWKRKIFIIVGTLICMVVAGVASLRLPERYRAQALVRIGKTLNASSGLAFFDTLENMVRTIPIEYALEDEGALKYDLDAQVVKGTSLIKVVLEGPSIRKVKELLEDVIERIIENHFEMTESTIQLYKTYIEKRNTDIRGILDDIDQEAFALKEVSIDREDEMGVETSNGTNEEKDINKTDFFALIQDNLKRSRTRRSSIQDDILSQQFVINSIKREKTTLIGGVEGVVIKTNKRRNIMLGGVAGLMISFFLALFLERWRGKLRKEEKENNV